MSVGLRVIAYKGNTMSGWGCPHDINGICQKVLKRKCDPGMKGCVLAGRFIFSDGSKNTRSAVEKKDKPQGK